jgi:hypothetical protein
MIILSAILRSSMLSRFSAVFFLLFVLFITCSAQALAQDAATKPDSAPSPQAQGAAQSQSAKPGNPASAAPVIPVLKPEPRLDAAGHPLYESIQEDWSSLQIGASKLEPKPPLVGEVADKAKFTRTLVQVQWRPGDPIDLWIIVPKGVKKPPVVLYLYNYIEEPERFHTDAWCERVTSGGVAAVGFLSALSTDRFRDRPMKQWFVSELQESIGSTVHDVKFILDYLELRGDLDMTRVGMFGDESGGAIAILAAAADPRIKAVDALEPWGDWPDFLTQSPIVSADPNREDYGKPEFLKKVAPLDPVKWLPQLKTPIRVQQVQHNLTVPMESKEAIKAALPKQAELLRFEGLDDLSRREGGGRLFDWIKEKVQDAGAAQSAGGPKASVEGETAAQIPKGKDSPALRP